MMGLSPSCDGRLRKLMLSATCSRYQFVVADA